MARTIRKVILHCSDTPEDDPSTPLINEAMDVGVKEISEWHKLRNFPPYRGPMGPVFCGYHKVVRINGAVETARPDFVPGVHCTGENHDSVAICYIGRGHPTDAQKKSLLREIINWMNVHFLEVEDVYGHYEWNKTGKTCPNLDMDLYREDLKQELRRNNGNVNE